MNPPHNSKAVPADLAAEAEERFLDWVVEPGRGTGGSIDSLCREHPQLAQHLQELHQAWQRVNLVCERLCGSNLIEELKSSRLWNDAQGKQGSKLDFSRRSPAVDAAVLHLISSLRRRSPESNRYRLEGALGMGGMGAVEAIWDSNLQRRIARKSILPERLRTSQGPSYLARFIEEAQVTAQLDHPGIVPVHELGFDERSQVYFTMKLVRGETLEKVLEQCTAGSPAWPRQRVIEILKRVCEAMSYAHEKGVVHRDLTPRNVMVGRHGEVYVMDWGVAKVASPPDPGTGKVDLTDAGLCSSVLSNRDAHEAAAIAEHLATRMGDRPGTPAWMSPEMASGALQRVGPQSDVYALGCMLYQVLSGYAPYLDRKDWSSADALLELVKQGPPTRLEDFGRRLPVELVAICERAMAHDPQARYPDMGALASDLQAFIDRRAVSAYRVGTWVETRKWIARNRLLAGSLLSTFVLVLTALLITLNFYGRLDRVSGSLRDRNNLLEERTNEAIQARSEAIEATAEAVAKKAEAAELAERERELRSEADEREREAAWLITAMDLRHLLERIDQLWPLGPTLVPQYQAWIDEAEDLLEGDSDKRDPNPRPMPSLAELKSQLIETQGLKGGPALPAGRGTPTDHRPDGGLEEPDLAERSSRGGDLWWTRELKTLVQNLSKLADRDHSPLGIGSGPQFGWSVGRRLLVAQSLENRSFGSDAARERWDVALEDIRNSLIYKESWPDQMPPQIGLLPIEKNTTSGLWEFAFLPSSQLEFDRDQDPSFWGREGGIRMVLVPGGQVYVGTQSRSKRSPNYDPTAEESDQAYEHRLLPFFIAKHELTTRQWSTLSGRFAEFGYRSHRMPQTSIAAEDAELVLGRFGLELPNDSMWEHAARAGTNTPWWTGKTAPTLKGHVLFGVVPTAQSGELLGQMLLDDHSENPFGLEDILGSVYEMCSPEEWRDRGVQLNQVLQTATYWPVPGASPDYRFTIRGGCYSSDAEGVRVAKRMALSESTAFIELGLRPARKVTWKE